MTDTNVSAKQCGVTVYWWDGEYEGECELPEGHDGPHFDGMSWYDDDNQEVDAPDKATGDD